MSAAVGASLTAVIVILKVPFTVPPTPSSTVKLKESLVVSVPSCV